jgi:hypothetical protein
MDHDHRDHSLDFRTARLGALESLLSIAEDDEGVPDVYAECEGLGIIELTAGFGPRNTVAGQRPGVCAADRIIGIIAASLDMNHERLSRAHRVQSW